VLRSCARVFSVLGASSRVLLQVLARIWRVDDATALRIVEKLSSARLVRSMMLHAGAVRRLLDAAYAASFIMLHVQAHRPHDVQCVRTASVRASAACWVL
jgi:hypothetical protein